MKHTDQSEAEQRLEVDQVFIKRHGPWMLALAQRVLMDDHLAEDAVQEALLTVHTKGDSFEGRAEVRTWLYRVTVNAALALRRRHSVDEWDIDDLQPLFDTNACRIETPWGQMRTVEEVMEQAELSAFVRQCVKTLPEDYRICLQLRDLEELPVKGVADLLGISEENVKVRTHRARSALKRLLEPLLRGKPIEEITSTQLPDELKPSLARTAKGVMMAYMPMMITCQQFEDFISDYLEESLPKEKAKAFEFHIRTCRECREYLAAYQRARLIARETMRMTTLDDIPEDLLTAVISSIDT